MDGPPPAWTPRYDAALIEEAVAHALRARPRAPYWRERSRVYDLEDEERRAREFLDLASAEFERLELGKPVDRALRERPILAGAVEGCLVAPAVTSRDEGAELFVAREGGCARRSVVIRLRPSSFSEPGPLLDLLRHEVYHIADMVDPSFGYDPVLEEAAEEDPARVKLIVGRYAALWDATIDGRLAREGRAPAAARAFREREFAAAFPMLGESRGPAFRRWFDEALPTHESLMAFARRPSCQAAPAGPPRP
jgi:hypothetical protein